MPMPWGLAWLVFYQGNLGFLCFQDPQEDEARLRTLIYKRWPLPLNERSEKLARSDGQAVLDYWRGKRSTLPWSVHLRGTDLERAVWHALLEISRGEVCSYQAIAERVGRPKAVRAVASAIGRNPVSLLVPCHRVLRKNGALGGYAWGLSCKEALLKEESVVLV